MSAALETDSGPSGTGGPRPLSPLRTRDCAHPGSGAARSARNGFVSLVFCKPSTVMRRLSLGALILATLATTPAVAQQNSGLVAEFLSRLDAQEAAIRRLTAELEALQFETRQQERALEARISDLELRIIELEGGDPFAVTEPAAPVGSNPPPASEAPAAPAPGSAPVLAPPPTTLGTVRVSENDAEERQTFEEARRTLAQDGIAAGVNALAAFDRQFPDSVLRGEGALLLGDAYFDQGRYTDAARQYVIGARDFPDGPRAPESLIGLGRALVRLGRPADGCGAFRDVPRRFPAASPAVLNRARAEAAAANCL